MIVRRAYILRALALGIYSVLQLWPGLSGGVLP